MEKADVPEGREEERAIERIALGIPGPWGKGFAPRLPLFRENFNVGHLVSKFLLDVSIRAIFRFSVNNRR